MTLLLVEVGNHTSSIPTNYIVLFYPFCCSAERISFAWVEIDISAVGSVRALIVAYETCGDAHSQFFHVQTLRMSRRQNILDVQVQLWNLSVSFIQLAQLIGNKLQLPNKPTNYGAPRSNLVDTLIIEFNRYCYWKSFVADPAGRRRHEGVGITFDVNRLQSDIAYATFQHRSLPIWVVNNYTVANTLNMMFCFATSVPSSSGIKEAWRSRKPFKEEEAVKNDSYIRAAHFFIQYGFPNAIVGMKDSL